MRTVDFHIHSRFSGDSTQTWDDIKKYSIKRGIDCVAITDHNVLFPYEEFCGTGFPAIIQGEEIDTDCGQIGALFIKKEIKEGAIERVLHDIKRQGGLSVLLHYGRGKHTVPDEVIKDIDAIEVFNGRCNEEENRIGAAIARRLHKLELAGSDAHIPQCIGRGHVRFPVFSTTEELRVFLMSGGGGEIIRRYPSAKEKTADKFFTLANPKKIWKTVSRTIPMKIKNNLGNRRDDY